MRWGVLGAGRIAAGALVPAMHAAGHRVRLIGSRSLPRARAFASAHGVDRACGSYRQVVESPEVDAVYVALPNDAHEPWTLAALDAGKHVLCEKPLAVDAAAAQRMAAAADTSGRVLLEAMMARFHPRTQALLDAVRAGEAGDVRLVTAAFCFTLETADDFRLQVARGGGALLDVGVYAVHAVRLAVPEEPATVAATARLWSGGVDATTSALLGYPSGAAAAVHASFEAAPYQSVAVVGSRATFALPDPYAAGADRTAVLLRDGEPVGSWRANPYEAMLRAFAAATAGAAPVLPAAESVATARVLDRIRVAAAAATPARPPPPG